MRQETFSVAHLLAEAIDRTHEDASVTELHLPVT
jgi:hypothetical protein